MRSGGAAWWFVAPALIVIGVFFVLPVLAALAMAAFVVAAVLWDIPLVPLV